MLIAVHFIVYYVGGWHSSVSYVHLQVYSILSLPNIVTRDEVRLHVEHSKASTIKSCATAG